MTIVLRDPEKFKELLVLKGFSQRGLGRAVGISEVYATQICSATRNPGPTIARKIVETLHVEFDEIFFINRARNSKQTTA